ncbi:right-handed parallel beta-helix repeat-containing protein [Lewinella sp. 4G2]|uniref:right-handed parallel beta-helix repeat-containing protein n=1 Tax=Lewinella sp. 4G2 TaxID=1803372 RepID=UPI0007B4A59B|nr:right-handed parallel beta-helix repeat-containing protein [Lewinella sp. 4G2]OAV44769.1 hypothetical protein A3850_009825 [Lewinella sp. 4G2]
MLRILLTLLILVPALSHATSVKVSEAYGYDATDATNFLRQALGPNSTADTVIIDNVGEWFSERIFVNRDDVTILLEPGTIVTGLAGAFEDTNFKFFNIRGRSNVHFIGYGATIRMVPGVSFSEGDPGGFRHLLNFGGCTNISVIGLELRDSGGDGIQVSKNFQDGGKDFCENVVIRDCFLDNNYRQGISITGGKNVLIENCEVTNTEGALPSSGIDFEPSFPEEVIQNCVVRNCRITDNAGRGIQNGFGKSDATTPPIKVLIEDTYIARNGTSNSRVKAGGITLNVGNNGVTGNVTVRNVLIEDQPYDGLFLKSAPASVTVDLENVILRNVANHPDTLNTASVGDTVFRIARPIQIEANFRNPTLPFGGVTFTNVVVEQDQDIQYLVATGNNQPDRTLQDVTGNITVISPFTPTEIFSEGGNVDNVGIVTTALTNWPSAEVSITALDEIIAESPADSGAFEISLSNALSVPAPVLYDVTGSATNRIDYNYAPGLVVVPAGATDRNYFVKARRDNEVEESEDITFNLNANTPFQISPPVVGRAEAATISIGATSLPVAWGEVVIGRNRDCRSGFVRWETTAETDVRSFQVEYRVAGSSEWRSINQEVPAGVFTYGQTIDRKLLVPGTVFRVKQYDWDGRVNTSPLATVLDHGCPPQDLKLGIYPQPARGGFHLVRVQESPAILRILDFTGREVHRSAVRGVSAYVNINLPAGTYLITVSDGSPVSRLVVH